MSLVSGELRPCDTPSLFLVLHVHEKPVTGKPQYLFKASAHSFKRFTLRLLKLSFSLSMHLLLWMNVMLDFIWTLPVQLRGTLNKWTLQKKKIVNGIFCCILLTRSVASKIFNYKASQQQIDFDGLSQNPTPCSCCDSEFLYASCGHIVTGDISIELKDVLRKGPKYREHVSFFSWHQTFSVIMAACEEYARRWAKKEDVEVDTLSEWVKSIADVLKRRIWRLKRSVNTRVYFLWLWGCLRTFPSPWELCHSSCRQSF